MDPIVAPSNLIPPPHEESERIAHALPCGVATATAAICKENTGLRQFLPSPSDQGCQKCMPGSAGVASH